MAESGLWEHYSKEKGEKGISRRENLEELINAARQFEWEEDESGMNPLAHAMCRIAFVLQNIHEGTAIDDRYKKDI